MATCSRIEVPVPEPEEFELKLTKTEAETLRCILGQSTIAPYGPRSQSLTRIYNALGSAGVKQVSAIEKGVITLRAGQ